MKSKKGFVLPLVVGVMSIITIITMAMFTVLLSSNITNKYNQVLLERKIAVMKIKDDFIADGQVSNDYGFNCQIYENTAQVKEYLGNSQDIKALAVSNSEELLFVCVYDFDEDKIVSSQTSNYYITTKDIDGTNYYFFADLVKYKGVE